MRGEPHERGGEAGQARDLLGGAPARPGAFAAAAYAVGDLVYARDDPGKLPGRIVSLADAHASCTVEWDDRIVSSPPLSALARIVCACATGPQLPEPEWLAEATGSLELLLRLAADRPTGRPQ